MWRSPGHFLWTARYHYYQNCNLNLKAFLPLGVSGKRMPTYVYSWEEKEDLWNDKLKKKSEEKYPVIHPIYRRSTWNKTLE